MCRGVDNMRAHTHTLLINTHNIPLLPPLPSYVQKVLLPVEEIEERMQKQFVCQQLLSIFSVMDLSDEVGK